MDKIFREKLKTFIKDTYICDANYKMFNISYYVSPFERTSRNEPREEKLDISEYIRTHHFQETFSQYLFRLIDSKHLTDTEVYKKAFIDRRLFSRIRSNIDYHPSKKTVMALIIAMGLDKNEASRLLELSGYSFNCSDIFDVIILYFINVRKYDIIALNEALVEYNINPLGCEE